VLVPVSKELNLILACARCPPSDTTFHGAGARQLTVHYLTLHPILRAMLNSVLV
jgi:hypothetical protein